MKTWTAFALLLVLAPTPAKAQQAKEPEKKASDTAEIEMLELKQDVDKTLLREALLLLGRGREGMTQSGGRAERREAGEIDALKKFVDEKEHAYIQRAGELTKRRAELKNQQIAQANPTRNQVGQVRNPVDEKERQGLVEKLVESQVEVQLLQSQEQSYQQTLNEAIQALTKADFAAGDDPTQQEKADAARKRFDKAKTKYVDITKRLQAEQGKIGEMQSRTGYFGMGGMGGMGGGMR